MNSTLLAIIGSALTLIIGLWKWFSDKDREVRAKIEEAAKEIERGIDEGDVSAINSGIQRLGRL